jgi:uncharacterized OsmC-like protein
MPEVACMSDESVIKDSLERNLKAVAIRASVGQGTARTVATLGPKLSCIVKEGTHTLTAGMTVNYGGTDAGPTPGALGRAALASCLALGIAMWAARMDVRLEALTVEVEADFDVRGELGIDDTVHPGYGAMRYVIRAKSPAPASRVRAMLDTAIKYSSYIDNFARAVSVTGELHINEG